MKLWDKYKLSKNNNDHAAYKESIEEFNCEKGAAIRKYEENVMANKKTNPKHFYRYMSSKEKYKDNTTPLNKITINWKIVPKNVLIS